MNCKVAKAGGFEPPWSHFSDEVGGAGRIGAQMGELVGFRHNGFWQCMDTKRDRDNLEEFWRSGKAPWKQ